MPGWSWSDLGVGEGVDLMVPEEILAAAGVESIEELLLMGRKNGFHWQSFWDYPAGWQFPSLSALEAYSSGHPSTLMASRYKFDASGCFVPFSEGECDGDDSGD